ncbi:MAG: LPS export ABC transporter permease LptG [Candidatus Saccharibacteria bacterium]|nr:LPS export ABC transporter permease LptG [Pseudorhodobacter sp.]
MTLNFYIARRFLGLFLRVFAGFFGLMMMIDIIDELRSFDDPGISLGEAAVLALMNVPATIYQVLPLILILSAIGLFLGLARSSELVVVRAAGRSGLSFLVAPVLTALAIGAFAVTVLNPIVAATSKRYDALSAGHARGGSVLSMADGGLWLRQSSEEGQTVIHAERANLDGTELFDVTFLTFARDGTPVTRIGAAAASLQQGYWAIRGAKSWPMDATNPERQSVVLADGTAILTDLTRDRIRDSFGTPSAIGFWDLPAYIQQLEAAGFSARSHKVWLQMEIAQPLLLVAMVLIAAGFTMRHARTARQILGYLARFRVDPLYAPRRSGCAH